MDKEKKEIKEPDFEKLASEKRPSAASRFTTAVLLLICLVLAGAILFKMFSAPEAVENETRESVTLAAINVAASYAETGTFSKISRMNGEISRDGNDIAIYPDITSTGTVTEVLVKEGDAVRSGDIIAYIDSSRPGSSFKVSPVVARADGVVTELGVSRGETINSGTAIATLTNLDDLIIEASIPEKFLGTLREGMTAEFESVAYPGRIYTAVLTYIAPTVDKATRSSDIKLTITGDMDGLREGMYIKLNLETEHQENVMMVPSTAISEYLGDDVVFIVDNDVARRQIVTTGSSNGTETVILSGLSEDDLVITAGNVTDGTAISVV